MITQPPDRKFVDEGLAHPLPGLEYREDMHMIHHGYEIKKDMWGALRCGHILM
jgi:hypothetical protein